MGTVYEVTHCQIGGRAALKLLRPHLAQDPMVAARFLNEARATRRIQHPGVIQIHDFGETANGSPYLIMEYLDGETLRQRLRRKGSMGLLALRFGRQIASAMAAAHRCGVIHRDLKPDNVMVVADPEISGGERVKVLDFGIAKLRAVGQEDGERMHTAPLDLLGTPAYMAPELCRGATEATPQSDVYALGALFYEMLVGVAPFTGANNHEILYKQMFCPPPVLEVGTYGLPEEIGALVARTLSKDPSARPTMEEVAAALEEQNALYPPSGLAIPVPSTLSRANGQAQPPALKAAAQHTRRAALRTWAMAALLALGLPIALPRTGPPRAGSAQPAEPAPAPPSIQPPPAQALPPPMVQPPVASPPAQPAAATPEPPMREERPQRRVPRRPSRMEPEDQAPKTSPNVSRRMTNADVPIFEVPDPDAAPPGAGRVEAKFKQVGQEYAQFKKGFGAQLEDKWQQVLQEVALRRYQHVDEMLNQLRKDMAWIRNGPG